jgi:hypothetical protein
MTALTDIWRQLVRRRLWPVALVLVAALVAVPLTLAKSPAPAPPPPRSAGPADSADATASYVTLAVPDATAKRRRVLGATKDPFEPAPLPKKKKKHAKVSKAVAPTPTSTPDAPASGSGGAGGGSTAPPSAAPTPAPTLTVAKGSVKVRFGLPSDTENAALPELLIGHLEALPSSDAPVVVLERLKDNGKTAVFSIPGDITAVGDGKCQPTPEDCTSLELRAGQTQFITVKGGADDGTDVQYQVDLLKIYTKATKVPKDSVPVTDGASS